MESRRDHYGLPVTILVGLILWGECCWGQSYPTKPLRMLVGYSPGGSTDLSARLVAKKLSEDLGQPVLVENRLGATGVIAMDAVAKSPPDGYMLTMVSASVAVLPAVVAKLPFDLERDLTPISMVATVASVLVVHASVPVRDLKQLIALARSQPGKLNYASNGVGSSVHLAGELFNLLAKVKIVHVPYKGGPESTIALVTGQVDISFASVISALPFLKSGKLRPIAVTTAKRSALLPSIPTIKESGLPDFDQATWVGILAPAGVPKDIVSRLNMLIGAAVNTPEMKEAFLKLGIEAFTTTPEEFSAFLHREIVQNAKLVKLAGVKAE